MLRGEHKHLVKILIQSEVFFPKNWVGDSGIVTSDQNLLLTARPDKDVLFHAKSIGNAASYITKP
ncbi:MAG: hypothetical protein FD159_1182 [Syntrophaceae bacterium]|nr:MAG: hypothetical protein FD159_1182 [Syntrophaceae bacterium]